MEILWYKLKLIKFYRIISGIFNKLHKMGFKYLDRSFTQYRDYWGNKRKKLFLQLLINL